MRSRDRCGGVFDKTLVVLMVIGAALIIFDTLAVSVSTLLRYSLGISWVGLFEITEYSLLWMTFLGTAWLLKNNGHVSLEMVLNRLSLRCRTITNIVTAIMCAVLFGVLTWYTFKLTLHDYQTGYFYTTMLQPPKWPIEIIIPIGSFLLIIQFLRIAYGHMISLKVLSMGKQAQSDSTSRGES